MAKILIIDDDKSIRSTLREILEFEGYSVEEAANGEEAWALLQKNTYDVALCDIKMPRMNGMELLEKVLSTRRDVQFIMVSAHGSIETAVEATKLGAYDFIAKPPDLNRLLVTVRNAIDRSSLVQETKFLKQQINRSSEIIGDSVAIQKVKQAIEKVGPTEARILITGPNGSGKELVAKAVHAASPRAGHTLVVVNCAAIPGELIESELFGHEKGSFTGALRQHIGKFEQAHQGTLFLDEIGDMSLSAQAKVLRALQESKITRVGGHEEITVDVRILAATNKDLRKEIAEGRFREDLYHRLNVIPIHVPPLTERKEDIPLLISKFLRDIAAEYGTAPSVMAPQAVTWLQNLAWTGNVRELRNVTERLIIMGGNRITLDDAKTYAPVQK